MIDVRDLIPKNKSDKIKLSIYCHYFQFEEVNEAATELIKKIHQKQHD